MPDKPNFEAQVGFFSLIALILLLYGWSWLHGLSLFHPPQKFVVEFHDVAGLNNNAPVQVNGVRIGTVNKLSLIKKGLVEVDLKISTEGDFAIPEDSVFTIQTQGLVGAKYVEVTLPDEPMEHLTKIAQGEHVKGVDPVRVELVMNKIGTSLSHIDFSGVQTTLSKNMERMAKAADSVQSAADRFGTVASDAKSAAKSANKFFSRGTNSFDRIDQVASNSHDTFTHFTMVADDWRTTSHKLNRILDNPALAADLKDTMEKAHATAQTIANAIHELTGTLGDQPMRQDLLAALKRLNDSTDNVYKSVQIVKQVSSDKEMRTEFKDMLAQARETMDKVSTVVNQPAFGPNLKNTIDNVNRASIDLDMVARQMHGVLDKKHPLWQMMWGRPGYIKEQTAGVKKDVVVKPDSKDKSSTDIVVPDKQPVLVVPVQQDSKPPDTTEPQR